LAEHLTQVFVDARRGVDRLARRLGNLLGRMRRVGVDLLQRFVRHVGSSHVAIMSRLFAGSQCEPLKINENMLQRNRAARDTKSGGTES
jgi:hypothetical protein